MIQWTVLGITMTLVGGRIYRAHEKAGSTEVEIRDLETHEVAHTFDAGSDQRQFVEAFNRGAPSFMGRRWE